MGAWEGTLLRWGAWGFLADSEYFAGRLLFNCDGLTHFAFPWHCKRPWCGSLGCIERLRGLFDRGVKIFHVRCWGQGGCCDRVFWAKYVQDCLRRRFLHLQVVTKLGVVAGSNVVLPRVPWSGSEALYQKTTTSPAGDAVAAVCPVI